MDLHEIISALEGLSPEQQAAAIAEADKVLGKRRWTPNPGPQTDAYFSEADELFYGGMAGGGKLQALDSKVLTPTGWTTMGALRIGSSLCATDGTVQEVIALFPQGKTDLYRVTFDDGGSTETGLDHNWLAWRTHAAGKKNNISLSGASSARKWTTRQILAEMQAPAMPGRPRGFAIPCTAPVRFNVAGQLKGRGVFVGREIEPYLLGLLLGDGHVGEKSIGITSADAEIGAWLFELFGSDVVEDTRTGNQAKQYRFRGEALRTLRRGVTALGLLGKKSHDKFIPRQYLLAPVDVRWRLLQGLMDTDGWVEPKRAVYYVSVSKRLADDVEHLARSLGAVTSRTVKAPTYTHQGGKKAGQTAYCIRMKFADASLAFSLPRKREVARGIAHQSMGRKITSIAFSRTVDEAMCIAVSNPNSLYITDDFIVTHNSDLAIGLAITEHHRSLLLRRTNKEALGLVERMAEVIGNRDGWSGQQGIWRLEDNTVEISGCQLEEDRQKFKGQPHDLIIFDEVSDFTESQYSFIIGWNRSAKPGQRSRVVATGNPPTRPEGLWVLKRWAAWLDPSHSNPAAPGELRWYTTSEEGHEIEVEGLGPHIIGGEAVIALSRTFIPAKLSDNPDLAATNYAATLAALPEELRAAYRDGRFDAGLKDAAYQCIPTAWVRMAQERWTEHPPEGVPCCAMGVDASGGGTDPMIIARRHDGWYAPIIRVPAKEIPIERAGAYCAGIVISHRRDDADVIVDLGGGYGSSMYEQLHANGIKAIGYKGSGDGTGRDISGRLGFKNARTAAIWRFREALDPGQPGGSSIMLPPSATLLADLTAPTYEPDSKLITVESKESVCKRLGRSTDEGDAVVMAWTRGLKQANLRGGFKEYNARRIPQVVLGHQQVRRR